MALKRTGRLPAGHSKRPSCFLEFVRRLRRQHRGAFSDVQLGELDSCFTEEQAANTCYMLAAAIRTVAYSVIAEAD